MEHTPAPYGPRAVYGYAMYIGSNMLFLLYVVWAIVPDQVLHNYLGLTYWPSKYWAVAIPIWALTALAVFAFIIYPAINLSITPDIDDITTITDKYVLHKTKTISGGIPPVSDIPITEDKIYNKEKNHTDGDDNDDHHLVGFHNKLTSPLEIMDLRLSLKNKINKNVIFCSFELVSVRRSDTFYQRLFIGMSRYSPLFYAFTCHHNTSICNKNYYLPLDLIKSFSGNNILLHLTATDYKRNEIIDILRRAVTSGITNIFALQGDSCTSFADHGDFKYAADLVKFIRQEFGDIFCICVAGYPQMHPKSPTKDFDLYYLKAKVDAGADFIITQIFFESQIFINFVKDCRKVGIQVPIIPGILAVSDYECIQKMAHISKLVIPTRINKELVRIKDNDQAMKDFIIKLLNQIIIDIIKSGTTHGFHLFTLNRLSLVEEICKCINFLNQSI